MVPEEITTEMLPNSKDNKTLNLPLLDGIVSSAFNAVRKKQSSSGSLLPIIYLVIPVRFWIHKHLYGINDTLLTLQKAGLNPAQIASYKSFVRGNKPVTVYRLPNDGMIFERIQPSNIPGSYIVLQKGISRNGERIYFGKKTYGPKGEFVHGNVKATTTGAIAKKDELYIKNQNLFDKIVNDILKKGV